MDVSNGLPLHEIKQETDFEITFSSDGSLIESTPRPQIEFTNNNNNNMELNNTNYIIANNENNEEVVDNKETTLKTIQMMQEAFVDDANEPLHISTNTIPQTSRASSRAFSRTSFTKGKKFLPGECPSQWPQAATRLLIDLYKEYRNLFESPIINKKDSWKRISTLLGSKGYPYPPSVCDNKFRALKYRYNLLKESNGKSTMGRRKWEFFQPMEQLMADCPFQSTESVSFSSANCKKPTTPIKKIQFSPKSLNLMSRNRFILPVRSTSTLNNQSFPSERNIRTMHHPREKLVNSNSSSFMSERNQDALQVRLQTAYTPKIGALPSIVPKRLELPSKNVSGTSGRASLDPSVENPTPNGPPSWFVKFQEESLKRLGQIEQMDQRKITAYEHRNILIDQRTKVLANIGRSLERVADSVEKNPNGSSTTRKDLLMTFSELLKRIEDT